MAGAFSQSEPTIAVLVQASSDLGRLKKCQAFAPKVGEQWSESVRRWLATLVVVQVPPPPPASSKLRPCPSHSGRRHRINLVPNLIRYKCSAAT